MYVFVCNVEGEQQFVTDDIRSQWAPHWTELNDIFKMQFLKSKSLHKFLNVIFLHLGWQP